MGRYTQDRRPLAVETPLGKDVLLLEKFRGTEAIGQLFQFELDMLAESPIDFKQVVGKEIKVTLHQPQGVQRTFAGIVSRLAQGQQVRSAQGESAFVRYHATMVPKFWLLTKRIRNRIFQDLTLPEMLQQVLADLDVKFELATTYPKRNYCVQYQESDFAFACRLMEEDGLAFFFGTGADAGQMIVTDQPVSYPSLESPERFVYDVAESSYKDEVRVRSWQVMQEVCSGKYQTWDHSFELPDSSLAAEADVPPSATVGTMAFDLTAGDNSQLGIYEYPGLYSKRFDGVGRDGSSQENQLQTVFHANQHIAKIRMEQEAAEAVSIKGGGNCGNMQPGYVFDLTHHFAADGSYLLTEVEHSASIQGAYTSDRETPLIYTNEFRCVPKKSPYRPRRTTPRPRFEGVQTALVVGIAGEDITTDKYGRVKVQFYWDTEGKKNIDSSCWVRVAQQWAGSTWGALTLPRVGQDVIVAYEDGDVDRPIILGSLYNANQMPPYKLPAERRQSGWVSSSGKSVEKYHEIRMDDTPGKELLHFHSEKDMQIQSENNHFHTVGGNQVVIVGANNVAGSGSGGGGEDTHPGYVSWEQYNGNVYEEVNGDDSEIVNGDFTEKVYGTSLTFVKDNEITKILGNDETFVAGDDNTFVAGLCGEYVGGVFIEAVLGMYCEIQLGLIVDIEAGLKIESNNVYSIEKHNGHLKLVAEDSIHNVDGAFTDNVTGIRTTTTQGISTTNSVGVHTISSEASIVLQCDASVITMTPTTITLAVGDNTISITPLGIILEVGSTVLNLFPSLISMEAVNIITTAEVSRVDEATSATMTFDAQCENLVGLFENM